MRRALRVLTQVSVVPVLASVIVAGLAEGQQTHDSKPKVSDQPLSTEQLEIYKVVLHGWMDDGKGPFNLGIETVPLELGGPFGGESCAKGLELEPASPMVVHRFRSQDIAQLGSGKAVLVDPDEQSKDVARNDPGNSIRKGASIDEAVRNGFVHGLVTLSEIQFDVTHKHAIVWYGFRCGSLCGNGGTVVLEKKEGVWKRGNSCSVWMSRLTLPSDLPSAVMDWLRPV